MRVAVISGCEWLGGADVAASRLCAGLSARDDVVLQRFVGRIDLPHSPTIQFTYPGRGRRILDDVLGWFEVRDHPLQLRLRARKNRENLLRLLQDFAPDIINLHSINQYTRTHLSRDIAADLSEVAPVAWTLHDMWPLTGCCDYLTECVGGVACGWEAAHRQGGPVDGLREREAARMVAARERLSFVCPSGWMAGMAREAFGNQIHAEVIPNGLDLSRFAPLDRATARQIMGLPLEEPLLLAVATQLENRRKGMYLLVEALRGMSRPPLLVLLGKTGDGVGWPEKRVELGEMYDERLQRLAYAAADAVVVPSLLDNLPNVLLEAMACGTPCVGFNVGGIPEAIRADETGALAKPDNPRDLALAIERVLAMPSDRQEAMRKQCRRVAEQEYSLDLQAERYVDYFAQQRDA